MSVLILTIGILYLLGAFLMWVICDEEDPEERKKQPMYSALWPLVVIGIVLERLINKGDEA